MLERQVTCLVPGINMETYHGHVRSPADAIILFEACRIGLLPRVQRRLSEKERSTIKSGSIFVWDEREAGMRRWTDGKSWSASRVSGSFLTYREMEGKRGGNGLTAPLFSGNTAKTNGESPPDMQDLAEAEPDGYRYKPDGLMKQSFSITTSSGQHLHLISYYSRTAATAQNLLQPSQDPQLRHIRPEKGMYPESTVHDQNSIPAVTRGPMNSPGFAHSPHQATNMGSPYRTAPPSGPYPAYPPNGWAPPSPMHTPPQHYSPYYNGYPPAHIGQSPLQHMHYPAHPQAYQQPPPPTAFDRVPAPLSNNALPLPPPVQHQFYQPGQHQQPYHYPPVSAPYPPQMGSAPQAQPYLPPPPPQIPATTTAPPIDPKLTTDGSPRHDSVHPKHEEQKSTATSMPAQPRTTSPSSGTTIPSISSLINSTQQTAAPAGDQNQDPNRPGSHSPNAQARRMQDIPLHKIGFNPNNDARALRDLDKATFRA